jgi:hypothetical protein
MKNIKRQKFLFYKQFLIINTFKTIFFLHNILLQQKKINQLMSFPLQNVLHTNLSPKVFLYSIFTPRASLFNQVFQSGKTSNTFWGFCQQLNDDVLIKAGSLILLLINLNLSWYICFARSQK